MGAVGRGGCLVIPTMNRGGVSGDWTITEALGNDAGSLVEILKISVWHLGHAIDFRQGYAARELRCIDDGKCACLQKERHKNKTPLT